METRWQHDGYTIEIRCHVDNTRVTRWKHDEYTMDIRCYVDFWYIVSIRQSFLQFWTLMWGSHCPDFKTRWQHDGEKSLIVYKSGPPYLPSAPSYMTSGTIGSILHASGVTSGVEEKSLACQKISRWQHDGLPSCYLRINIVPVV